MEYKELSDRAKSQVFDFSIDEDYVTALMDELGEIAPRPYDRDGSTEVLDGVTFTHHFTVAPGDYDKVEWHYVSCGPRGARAIVFLHGIPDSWFQWHHQMASLSSKYLCIAVDLKGYGQSSKAAGDYRHEGAGEQLYTMLKQIGLSSFFLCTHDRGTVQGDFIVANHPDDILGYVRGEQHLYHFNPVLAPQGDVFRDAAYNHIMDDAKRLVCMAYTSLAGKKVSNEYIIRMVQEFMYPDTYKAVPRYFNSSTFLQEWVERRRRLLRNWKCPVLVLQGMDSRSQPREFYEGIEEHIPNSSRSEVKFISGGHFWTMESPVETFKAIEAFLEEIDRPSKA